MGFWRKVFVCVLVFCSCTYVRSQTTLGSPPSYYANFVGKWVGTLQSLQGDDRTITPVEITISLSRKNDRLRLDYVYGHKGDKGFDRRTRYLTLDPIKEELISKWDDSESDHYHTDGLDAFAKAGRGTFVAAEKTIISGKSRTDICVYTLEENTFSYHWKMTLDGTTFQPISTFSLQRISPQAAPTQGSPK